MELRPTSQSPDMLETYLNLFSLCFPNARHFSLAYLDWLYAGNPDGPVVGFDAFDGDQLAATYVCVPATVMIGAKISRALLSLNTATHPAHQGKGLFTRLASSTYALAASQGYDVVFGVANQNSIRGFSERLSFQNVAGLEARIGLGAFPRLDWPAARAKAQFRRIWTSQTLAWRVANPASRLTLTNVTGDLAVVAGRTGYPGIAVQGVTMIDGPRESLAATAAAAASLRLSIGLYPQGTGTIGLSLPIPDRFKPSPLRLIYRNLHDSSDRLDSRRVLFSFLDFDAY